MSSEQVPGSTNPATGQALEPVAETRTEQLESIVAEARMAQAAWAAVPLPERAERLLEAAKKILEDEAAGTRLLSDETGRGVTECRMSEVASLGDYVKGVIQVGKRALLPERLPLSALDFPGKRAVVDQVPRGVVAVIAPWNYPVGNFNKSVWPALLAGNAVIMKPSEHTPRSGAWLAKHLQDLLPKGLVSLVQGGGRVGQALLESGVDAVVFTGSVATGRRVAVAAAERLIPCSLELGGKDAAIVLGDCALERTVAGILQWGMHNAGQNCAGIERVYVEEAIADVFVDRLSRAAEKLQVAPAEVPTDLGPLQNPGQLAIVEEHVAEALEKGAKLCAGGKRVGKGYGYAPTILDRCSGEMKVVREETFGPVLAIVRVADAEEALRLANDSRYGLNGSVWTRDLKRGEELARRLEVGVALVNNHAFTGILPAAPWTGVKETGPGVAASRHAYHTYTRPRTVLVDKSRKPDPFWFPADASMEQMSLALVERNKGSFSALFKLAGLLGKRVKAITALVAE